MKKIEKIGEVRYCFPAILIEGSEKGKCSEKVHIPDVFDKLILKIDELVRRVNELMVMVAPDPIGKVAPRSPRPGYLPHGDEDWHGGHDQEG